VLAQPQTIPELSGQVPVSESDALYKLVPADL